MFFKKSEEVKNEDVTNALRQIIDPDLNRDIVALGFVKKLETKDGKVSVQIELTTPACPVKDEMKAQAEQLIGKLPGVKSVHVEMTAQVRAAHSHAGGTQGNRIQLPNVKNLIAVASGKGGVGKSTVTVNLAVALAETGAKVGLLDADIYGPSIPLMMGTRGERVMQDGAKLLAIEKYGIKMMSMGYAVEEGKPVIWRGPMVHGALTQFLSQTDWGQLDYLLIDMPPGTGDAQLTMSQTAPLSGAIIVTTPQEVSLIDARKGLAMFQSVKIPILGIVENMSGFICGHCNEVTDIFLKAGGEKLASENEVPFLGSLPLDPRVAMAGDGGMPVVLKNPDSEVAKRYRTMAGKMAAELSLRTMGQAKSFQPMELTWNP